MRRCDMCGANINHLRRDARFCGSMSCRTARAREIRWARADVKRRQKREADRIRWNSARKIDPRIDAHWQALTRLKRSITRKQQRAAELRAHITSVFAKIRED